LWPSWSWCVAVMVCGRHGCGRHGHIVWPSWFVAVVVVAVMVNFVAVMVCGRHGRTPFRAASRFSLRQHGILFDTYDIK